MRKRTPLFLMIAALGLAISACAGADEVEEAVEEPIVEEAAPEEPIVIDGLTELDAIATAEAEGDIMMEEPMMEDVAGILLTGMFVEIDVVHRGSGTAVIVDMGDGSYTLRLEDDFSVTRGPDLHVMLSGTEEPRNHESVMAEPTVDLGKLKGNMGAQNYEIPAGFDVTNAKSVVIYCVPFRVVFSTATLAPAG